MITSRYFWPVLIFWVASFSLLIVTVTSGDQKLSEVKKLFTNNGCTIYRFVDNGEYHYYSDCRGSTIKNVNEICGANCYEQYEETIITNIDQTNKK